MGFIRHTLPPDILRTGAAGCLLARRVALGCRRPGAGGELHLAVIPTLAAILSCLPPLTGAGAVECHPMKWDTGAVRGAGFLPDTRARDGSHLLAVIRGLERHIDLHFPIDPAGRPTHVTLRPFRRCTKCSTCRHQR